MATYYWVGGTGTWSTTGNTKFATSSGGTPTLNNPTTGDTVNFDANSGLVGASYTVTVNTTATVTTVNLANPSAGTVSFTLGADFTNTGTFAFTSGAISLSTFKLSCNIFSTSNSNTRSIAFGTGNITLIGSNTTIWSATTITGFTLTGTPTVNCTYSGSTGTRLVIHGSTAGGTEANAISINFSAGSDSVGAYTNIKNLNFTGFTGVFNLNSRTIYGNLTLNTVASGMTLAAGTSTTNFSATSGTQTITSASQTIDFPLTINGVGGTVQLIDALTVGSTRTLTLTNGTFNSNAKSVTVGAFSANNSNTKTLTLTNTTFTITNGTSTTGFFVGTTGTTFNLTGSNIVFTTSSVANFYSGVTNYPQVTMSGTGQLILGFSTTALSITTLANTTQPCTVSLLSTSGTLTVTNFNLNGTAGNLVTFNSSVAGTARTISKASGTVNALYLNVQDSTASGGAKWYANSSNDLGNNTGWNIFNNSFLQVF